MTPEEALNSLTTNTLHFLQTNLIVIAGKATSGTCTCYIGKHGTQPIAGAGYPDETFAICANNYPVGMPDAPPPNAPYMFQGHNTRMITSIEVVILDKIESYPLPEVGGPDIMITGQLSGCAFASLVQGAQTMVAHIQPNNEPWRTNTDLRLRTNLRNGGRFLLAPAAPFTSVFGVDAYNPSIGQKAYVIGVRNHGTWGLYYQVASASITSTTYIIDAAQFV